MITTVFFLQQSPVPYITRFRARFVLALALLGGTVYQGVTNEPPDMAGTYAAETGLGTAGDGSPEAVSRAEQVMRALAAAYPDVIPEAVERDGDWAVPVRGEWFYYAEGRLLPAGLRNRFAEYDPQPFYNYPAELPPWKTPGREEAERFRDAAKRRAANPPKRSQHFYDALWRAHSREESYERVKTIRFLGQKILVHYMILEELTLVEEQIRQEARTDAQVRQWAANLKTVSTWNWRSIAQTQSRSFHAYAAAIDLLPPSYRTADTYWLWTAEKNPQWWTVPYNRRLQPPAKVIKAFEARGFIWGGKWMFFDTMHFEYRPEILILNNLPIRSY
ncbi:hypothetical protein AGMMS50267_09000 [Spirochaetia bacterium]|nr:hypothetical protein AGMMS50267_09000 [Spirochaetia bacterium]